MNFIEKIKSKFGLQKQLLIITLSTIILSFASLALILPNLLTPFYEKNVYVTLNQSLHFVQSNFNVTKSDTIIVIKENEKYYISENFTSTFKTEDVDVIESKLKVSSGKFTHNGKNYYYVKYEDSIGFKAAIQGDSYIINQKARLTLIILPTLGLTLLMVVSILILYSNYLVHKISIINNKIRNINNKKYNHIFKFEIDDELNSLISSIEKMRKDITERDEYKSNMFQSLSHDLKTPIAVISSYIEAASDKIVTNQKALSVIKEETRNLNKKVALILQLNKINYLIENQRAVNEKINLTPTINSIIERYKIMRPDIKFLLKLSNKKFKGTEALWEQIIDNILNNFERYADKKIEITVEKKRIILYNDGPHIEDEVINNLFGEYKTGKKGKFGLGLSIVKKTLEHLGYKIKVVNEKKKGVSFIIE